MSAAATTVQGDDTGDLAEDASVLLLRSEQARTQGEYREGRRLAEHVVVLATATGDDAALAEALRLVCNQAVRLGDLEDAARAGAEAVVVAERLGDVPGQVEALNLLALSYVQLALYDEALEAIERSTARAVTLTDPDLRSATFNRAGTIRSAMGDFDEAAELFERSARELTGQDVSSETRFCLLTNMADLVLNHAYAEGPVAAEDLRRGVERSCESLTLAVEAGNPYRQALTLLNRGSLTSYLDDPVAAARDLEASRELSRAHGYRSLELGVVEAYAMDAVRRGDHATAAPLFEEVARTADALNDATVLVRAQEFLARCHEALGEFRSALEAYRRFHELETRQRTETAQVRARLLTQTVELQQLRSHAETLDRQAHEDPLTGLRNRRSFDAVLPTLLSATGEGDRVCVSLLDVDHFKVVNDTFGHGVGDEVLRRLGALLREDVRHHDLLARIGGEEFALVCVLRGSAASGGLVDGVRRRLDRLRRKVEQFDWGQVADGLHVTVSLGAVVGVRPDPDDGGELLRQADQLLYAAKAAGRNRVVARPVTSR
ncbi:tetratricopeptide repeat-containing diguanylate cyclase [Kineococcus sp. NPDC059986]|uniref:tetratricopeptide repeat-containing diguanylate cyclase n=1 Tax=Kineococcus sp. NPDC059986 TaxID=3155538 RepID=UPI00344C7F10